VFGYFNLNVGGKMVASYLRGYSWQRDLLIAGGIIFVFAFVGPFGTFDDMSFFVRLIYWTIVIYGCGAFFWVSAFLTYKIAVIKKIPAYLNNLVIVFFGSLPATALLAYNNFVFRSFETTSVNISFIPELSDLKPERWTWLWLTVFMIMIAISTVNFFSHFGKSLSKKEKHKRELSKIQIKTDSDILQFLARLPKEIGTDLVSLSMSDHYIDVTTKQGSALVHLKFSKAMKELKKYPGVQSHRSHWVSLSAIKNVKLSGRDKSVELFDGRKLPVSEKYKNIVKALN